tara:strand:- start:116 stop:517 length:402 start_codon:yes stop_codon:yes gene_type:complete
MSNICKSCGLPVWNDSQICDACSDNIKQQVKEEYKFNRREKNYQAIRWTNVTLFWIFYFLEVIFSELENGGTPSVLAVFITFWIARYFARKWYSKEENKVKSNFTKIAVTTGIYLSTFIIKLLVVLILLNLIL